MRTKYTLILVGLAFVAVLGSWWLSSLYLKSRSFQKQVEHVSVANNVDTSSKIMQDLLKIPDDSSVMQESNSLENSIQGF